PADEARERALPVRRACRRSHGLGTETCGGACFHGRMPGTPPPTPPELAMRIACDTAVRVQVDLSELVPVVGLRLRRSAGRRDWIETEALALEALGQLWDGELRDSCLLAL